MKPVNPPIEISTALHGKNLALGHRFEAILSTLQDHPRLVDLLKDVYDPTAALAYIDTLDDGKEVLRQAVEEIYHIRVDMLFVNNDILDYKKQQEAHIKSLERSMKRWASAFITAMIALTLIITAIAALTLTGAGP